MCDAITHGTFAWIIVIGVAVVGCATAHHDDGRDRASMLREPSTPTDIDRVIAVSRPASDVITAAELSAAPAFATATVYDLVVQLRPAFLSPRLGRAGRIASRDLPPAVFIDGMHSGGPEALRLVPAAAVKEMQYLRATDAMHRYGPSYSAGVIVVRLRR